MNIETVTEEDLDAITDCMVASFISDPTARFAWPKTGNYLKYYKGFASIFFEGAIKHGTAYRINGYAGGIAWYPPGESADFEKMGEYFDRTCEPDNLSEFMAVMKSFKKYHPHAPHWYLAMIGVDPFYQGKGLGLKLIEHNSANIVKDGVETYLESSNPDNVRLYERADFKTLDKLNLGGSPTMTPMLRAAK